MTKITIDQGKGVVEKTNGFCFTKKQQQWQLSRFEAVRLAAEATAVEDGYEVLRYTIILEAPGVTVELLSTDDEQHARSLHKKLADLLALRQSQEK